MTQKHTHTPTQICADAIFHWKPHIAVFPLRPNEERWACVCVCVCCIILRCKAWKTILQNIMSECCSPCTHSSLYSIFSQVIPLFFTRLSCCERKMSLVFLFRSYLSPVLHLSFHPNKPDRPSPPPLAPSVIISTSLSLTSSISRSFCSSAGWDHRFDSMQVALDKSLRYKHIHLNLI